MQSVQNQTEQQVVYNVYKGALEMVFVLYAQEKALTHLCCQILLEKKTANKNKAIKNLNKSECLILYLTGPSTKKGSRLGSSDQH